MPDSEEWRQVFGEFFEPDEPAQLGRYRIERKLGAGAMGAVYLARREGDPRPVVVKFLMSQLSDPSLRARFEREGRSLQRIPPHPNVVRVRELGDDGGVPYLVMELTTAPSLAEALSQQGTFPPDVVVSIGKHLARALRHGGSL